MAGSSNGLNRIENQASELGLKSEEQVKIRMNAFELESGT